MAKQVKAAKAETPKRGRPSKASGETEEMGTGLIKIAKSAMSVDLGVAVIRELAGADADLEKGRALVAAANTKRYDLQSKLTLAIKKAAENEASINLSIAFGDDQKAQTHLNNQIGIALGYRQVFNLPNGKTTVAYVKDVYPYFPAPGEDKDSPEYKRKQTTRSNFLARLKQCCMAASAIIADKTKAELDKDTGTLRLTGPAVQKQFGTSSVLLNEKQTVKDKKGEDIKLKEKPSFTAMAAKAAEAHGKTVHRGSNTRGAGPGGFKGKTPEQLVVSGCEAMISVLAKLTGDLSEATKAKLRAMVNAANEKLA